LAKSAKGTEIRGTGNSGPSVLQSRSTTKMAVASLQEPGKAMVGPADQHLTLGKALFRTCTILTIGNDNRAKFW
jgi:hypothetical protein